MIKGTQKKIIMLRNPKSRIFDEAYFVIKNDEIQNSVTHTDMVREANRIISASLYQIQKNEEKKAKTPVLTVISWYLLGLFSSGILFSLIYFLK